MQRKRPLAPRNTLETRLWVRLKALEGHRFRKRAPFRTFILDFVEHDARLVIALLDGEPGKIQPVHIVRDRLLNEQGYVILRLWRREVERDLSGAVHTIRAVLADLAAHDS
jgi:very-short-patch-repair endonuclease